MPVFKIDIVLSNGQSFHEHRIADELTLDTFYLNMYETATKTFGNVATFDIVQISEHAHVAKYMRQNGIARLTPRKQGNKCRPENRPAL